MLLPIFFQIEILMPVYEIAYGLIDFVHSLLLCIENNFKKFSNSWKIIL